MTVHGDLNAMTQVQGSDSFRKAREAMHTVRVNTRAHISTVCSSTRPSGPAWRAMATQDEARPSKGSARWTSCGIMEWRGLIILPQVCMSLFAGGAAQQRTILRTAGTRCIREGERVALLSSTVHRILGATYLRAVGDARFLGVSTITKSQSGELCEDSCTLPRQDMDAMFATAKRSVLHMFTVDSVHGYDPSSTFLVKCMSSQTEALH